MLPQCVVVFCPTMARVSFRSSSPFITSNSHPSGFYGAMVPSGNQVKFEIHDFKICHEKAMRRRIAGDNDITRFLTKYSVLF